MRFGRNILILLLLIGSLTAVLFLKTTLRPAAPLLAGDQLLTLSPELITSITWDIETKEGQLLPMTIKRHGIFWHMDSFYRGLRCDNAAVSAFIDHIQALRVSSVLSDVTSTSLDLNRTLTVSTPEQDFRCAFDAAFNFSLSQTLASCQETLIAVKTEPIAAFPQSAQQLLSRTVLPISPDMIISMEWRSVGSPFVRMHKETNGAWRVSQPFSFEPAPNEVVKALTLLTAQHNIAAYLLPSSEMQSPETLSESQLATYGLDEEEAIRVSIRVKGISDKFNLRFGKPDPTRQEHVFCLLDGRQSVVSVPTALRNIFTDQGPFITEQKGVPILGNKQDLESAIIVGENEEHMTTLKRDHAQWKLITPTALPANRELVDAFFDKLFAMHGTLIAMDDVTVGEPFCKLRLSVANSQKPLELRFCQNVPIASDEIIVMRSDVNQCYRVSKTLCPPELFALEDLNRRFLDLTIVELPANAIRRISVTKDEPIKTVVAYQKTSDTWVTEMPSGRYVDPSVIDAWLTLFADFQATTILHDQTQNTLPQSAHDFTHPHMTIALDLTDDSDRLRCILLISNTPTDDGLIPIMRQGMPLVYGIEPSVLDILLRDLTQSENAPQ